MRATRRVRFFAVPAVPARRGRSGRLLAAAALTAGALTLTACGTADGSADHPRHGASAVEDEGDRDDHNEADIAFAREMIPHHRQALEMSELAPDRAASPEVRALAEEIEAAQGPEIETLTGWLREWDAEGTGGHGDGGHETHDMHGMPGMLTEEQMDRLAALDGEAFDTAFLELMIEHHEGALEMAREVLEEGSHEPTADLAREIIDGQEAEIERMRELLGEPVGR
ncbi:DUF305 domain-containing protein [Streptomyces calidiresistens]|uniref:DUF305 domain-containing protein n=1 Tax=Streptomyces calidiresistens TaxID=1485586 RepID=A0A7W3T409_9ACTN|nr:DUF305 domain-containing protein [Streptomyces calidiresistens]MBB0230534.1 DUF305 domain-containing protein [Streptomyces calidiresistens]